MNDAGVHAGIRAGDGVVNKRLWGIVAAVIVVLTGAAGLAARSR
jgi:hypothetical protein